MHALTIRWRHPAAHLHHGTLNAVLMPAVLRFQSSAIGDKWTGSRPSSERQPDVAVGELNAAIACRRALAPWA